ncbi:MAG TPA: universal stress protein [Desulfobacterales bacterium]|nr:universal stress protein [Desulfobacterales bacterium]
MKPVKEVLHFFTRGIILALIVMMILIVMGYHPRGRLEEAIIGSVSRSVLRRSKVPVLLVRLPEQVD